MLQKLIPLAIGKFLLIKGFFAPKKATKQAFEIFCTPRKGRASEKHQSFFNTSIEERVNTNGHQIKTYHWKGSGETIILLHGWESNSFRWKSLIEILIKEGYNVIAVDAPAQGNSSGKLLSVPLYTECIKDIINIHKPSIVIGHSLGGMTAIYQQFKYRNPCIKKVIALGPPSELSSFMKSFQITLGLPDKFMKRIDNYLKVNYGFYAKEFSISKFSKNLIVDGLLILEKKDKLAPYKLSKRIADNWNNCELFTVENIGHSLQSPVIEQKIIAFIKTKTVTETELTM